VPGNRHPYRDRRGRRRCRGGRRLNAREVLRGRPGGYPMFALLSLDKGELRELRKNKNERYTVFHQSRSPH
jgi:hypothetical protein